MTNDSFQAWSNASKMPPHAAHIDAPEQLPPEPKEVVKEKIIEKPIYKDKIIYKDKVVENKKYITKDVDLSKPLQYSLWGLLILLFLFLGLWVWNYNFNTREVLKEKIVEVPSKTKTSIKYKTKEKVVLKKQYIEVSNTKELLQLKAEIIRLNRKITLLNRNNIELHKMTVRKFFKDPKRKSIKVTTRQY